MIRIEDDKPALYQWDLNRRVELLNIKSGAEVHFADSHTANDDCFVVISYEENGKVFANIPNFLLQRSGTITVYVYIHEENQAYTEYHIEILVLSRSKPSDYVYTETEVLNYSYLDKRIKELESDGLANAVADYLEKNPVQAGATKEEAAQIAKNKQDIETLNREKLSADALPGAVNEALAQAKVSGLFDGADGQDGYTPVKGVDYFDGKDGQDGKDGADGYTPQKGIDYFDGVNGRDGKDGADGYSPARGTDYWTEADKAEIAEAAAGLVKVPEATMKPLTFTGAVNATYDGSEAVSVEIPTGGAEWRKVAEIKTTEDLTYLSVTEDMDGNPFAFDEMLVLVGAAKASDATTSGNFVISPCPQWVPSFNAHGVNSFNLVADVYAYSVIFRTLTDGLIKMEISHGKRIAANMSQFSGYASNCGKFSTNVSLELDSSGLTITPSKGLSEVTNYLDENGKLRSVTIGTDMATSIKIGAGSTLEVWGR